MSNLSLVKKIDSVIRFFLYILIFWLPYSPAVVESCVVICLILWIFKRGIIVIGQRKSAKTLKEGVLQFLNDIKPESTFLNKPIAFFLLACVLSIANSAFFTQSLQNFFTKTLEWFIVYFLVVEVFKDKKHVYVAFMVFMFTAFSTVIDSLVQAYITYKDVFLGRMIEPGGRPTAGFKTSNGLGGYLMGVIPVLSAWIILGKQNFRTRSCALLILAFSIWSLIATFSRGAWIGAFFGGIFLLFIVLFPKERLKFYFSLGLFWVTAFLGISLVLILVNSLGQELLGRHSTIQWRLDVWSVSVEMIKDRPFFGHGINTFMRIFQIYRGLPPMDPTYAHNCYIQLAAETGLVGVLCFFWIIGTMFHQLIGKIKLYFMQDQNLGALAIGLLSGIFAFLVHSFFDTHFYSLQLSVYLWFMVGILVSISNISNTTVDQKNMTLGK